MESLSKSQYPFEPNLTIKEISEFAVLANRVTSSFGTGGLNKTDFEAKASSEYIHCIISDYYTALGRSRQDVESDHTSDIATAILAIFDIRARLQDYKISGPFEERKENFLAKVHSTTKNATAVPKPAAVENWNSNIADTVQAAWLQRNIFFRGFRSLHVDEEIAQAMRELSAAMDPIYTFLDSMCLTQSIHEHAQRVVAVATIAIRSISSTTLTNNDNGRKSVETALEQVIDILAASPFLQDGTFAYLEPAKGDLELRLWDPRLKYDPPLAGMVDAINNLRKKMTKEHHEYLQNRVQPGENMSKELRANRILSSLA